MGNSNDGLSESERKQLHGEGEYYEDEINLIDYFLVLGRHKLLIIFGSLLPAIAVGLFFYFSPRGYKLTYCYDVGGQHVVTDPNNKEYESKGESYTVNGGLDNKNYQILLDRFYSDRNIGQIVKGLESKNFNQYAEKVVRASNKSKDGIQELVDFEVSPSFIDVTQLKQADPEKLKAIKEMKADLLWMTITSKDKDNIHKAASVIRGNLEDVIPVYIIRERLKANARKFRSKMTEIEEDRFQRDIRLETNREILEKLENADITEPRDTPVNAGIEFDVGSKSEYLPLENQIQGLRSKIIEQEVKISINERKYKYYQDIVSLNNDILDKLKNDVSSGYTISQFRDFLGGLVDTQENEDVKNYLTSFVKRIDNRISTSAPVTEQPKISVVAKGTVKKAGVTFAIALLLSMFAAFLKEGIKQNEVRK